MNVRVKFRKYGVLKFIGHLDVMRYFQKAMRRADIDMCYSEGYSPHMIMSFAAPLGIGLTSEGEYMDIAVKESPSSEEAVSRLNKVMAEGIDIVSWKRLPEKSKNAMSIVAAADYEVRFREGYEPAEGWQKRLEEYLDQPEIKVIKETKKGSQEVDIRPWVYDCKVREDGTIFMKVSTGSASNLKPEMLLAPFGEQEGVEMSRISLLIHRLEIYADLGTEEERKLVALEELGEDIA